MARKRLVITLADDAYRQLVALAEAEERGVDQQASLLLKRLLTPANSSQGQPGRDALSGRRP